MSDGTDCQTALEKTMHREKVLIIVVPEEATEFASLLQEIANEIEQETGVKVNITYRDKALEVKHGLRHHHNDLYAFAARCLTSVCEEALQQVEKGPLTRTAFKAHWCFWPLPQRSCCCL